MCTSIAMKTNDFYFGRNMDLEFELNGSVVITPRNFPLVFRKTNPLKHHYAMLGMAVLSEGFPLYAEAVNEKGLCIAGLNFPDNAWYSPEEDPDKVNISPFELVHWILGNCSCINDVRQLVKNTHLVSIPFNEHLPLSPLHWHIADQGSSVVLENTRNGLSLFDNPVGVLTNNPGFEFQITNLCQFLNLTTNCPENCFSEKAQVKPFGNGLGCIGLPGDFSPASRFVKAGFLTLNSICPADEQGSVAQFFHLLDSVAMPRGSVIVSSSTYEGAAPKANQQAGIGQNTQKNMYEITTYSCCINASRGLYYYKTYSNNQLSAIDMNRENLNSCNLKIYPLIRCQQVAWQN